MLEFDRHSSTNVSFIVYQPCVQSQVRSRGIHTPYTAERPPPPLMNVCLALIHRRYPARQTLAKHRRKQRMARDTRGTPPRSHDMKAHPVLPGVVAGLHGGADVDSAVVLLVTHGDSVSRGEQPELLRKHSTPRARHTGKHQAAVQLSLRPTVST